MEDRRLERPLREKGIEKKKLNHNTHMTLKTKHTSMHTLTHTQTPSTHFKADVCV